MSNAKLCRVEPRLCFERETSARAVSAMGSDDSCRRNEGACLRDGVVPAERMGGTGD